LLVHSCHYGTYMNCYVTSFLVVIAEWEVRQVIVMLSAYTLGGRT